ncbi:lipoprotein [Glaciimonas immobilis]|nr:lipoprotein [Glaciimonas immobilis]
MFGCTLVFSLFLAGCGQKGPLFMPTVPPLAPLPTATPAAPVPDATSNGKPKTVPARTVPMPPTEPTGPDTISQ